MLHKETHTLKKIGATKLLHGLYVITFPTLHPSYTNFSHVHSFSVNKCNMWHQRLGQPSYDILIHISKMFPIPNMSKRPTPCDVCLVVKHKRLPFPNGTTHSNKFFDLIHKDIWGLFSTLSMLVHRYFLTFIDDHSCFCWIFYMKRKSETSNLVKSFISYVKTQFQVCVKTLRSDNGPEFTLKLFYLSQGIIHQTLCVDTPQQNRVVKRKHQHLLGVIRALLFQSHLPKIFGIS